MRGVSEHNDEYESQSGAGRVVLWDSCGVAGLVVPPGVGGDLVCTLLGGTGGVCCTLGSVVVSVTGGGSGSVTGSGGIWRKRSLTGGAGMAEARGTLGGEATGGG